MAKDAAPVKDVGEPTTDPTYVDGWTYASFSMSGWTESWSHERVHERDAHSDRTLRHRHP